jgi:hypothetical protein
VPILRKKKKTIDETEKICYNTVYCGGQGSKALLPNNESEKKDDYGRRQ